MITLLITSVALNVFLAIKAYGYKGASEVDSLSGLYNKRHFDKHFARPLNRKDDHKVLILIDVDNFKMINDTKGHAFGDKVIKTIGKTIKKYTRATDCAYRVGGDEFAILSDNIHAADRVVLELKKYKISISIGIAEFEAKDDRASVYKAADASLYQSKSLRIV